MDCTHRAYRDAVQTCDLVWVSLYRTKLSTASSATFFIHIVFLIYRRARPAVGSYSVRTSNYEGMRAGDPAGRRAVADWGRPTRTCQHPE